MSITVTTDVFCDGDDCQEWEHGVTGPRSNRSDARKEARRHGWTHRDGLDLCPSCSPGGRPKPRHVDDKTDTVAIGDVEVNWPFEEER